MTLKNNPTIIIPAFKRPNSLKRLLESLQCSYYPNTEIKLIISIDGDSSKEVVNIAENFKFKGGKKHVIKRDKNIGLREHILWCGDQTERYGSVIVLEDDLLVDPHFYNYSIESLNFYNDDDGIAGIALYSPQKNEYVDLPFYPLYNGTSSYLMQVPCSSGQIWTPIQWKNFKKWYTNTSANELENCIEIPEIVKKWPESSWKKYFAAYLIQKNLYISYPYISYTTNCSDTGGTHLPNGSNEYQVILPYPCRRITEEFRFESSRKSIVKYDAFFEASFDMIKNLIRDDNYHDCSFDLYGSKPAELLLKNNFTITSKKITNYICKYGLIYKPFELNIYYNIKNTASLYAYLGKSDNVKTENSNSFQIMLAEMYINISTEKLKKIYSRNCQETFEKSLSWRITEPLRWFGKIFNLDNKK